MRTTVTLDPDVETLVKQAMREQGIGFKQVINQAVRNGLAKRPVPVPDFRQHTLHLGRPRVDLTKALALADDLDDRDHGYKSQ